jgi:hypothetical protein
MFQQTLVLSVYTGYFLLSAVVFAWMNPKNRFGFFRMMTSGMNNWYLAGSVVYQAAILTVLCMTNLALPVSLAGVFSLSALYLFFFGDTTTFTMWASFWKWVLDKLWVTKLLRRCFGVLRATWITLILSRLSVFSLFAAISVGVVYRLRSKSKSNKQAYESIIGDIEKEGLTCKSALELFSVALKAGGLIAGLLEMGIYVSPKSVYAPSMVSDCLSLLAKLFPSSEPRKTSDFRDGLQPFIKQQFQIVDDDDDDDLGLLVRLKDCFDDLKELLYKYRYRLAIVMFASLTGMLIFLYVYHRKRLNWILMIQGSSLDGEAKGKTKGKNRKKSSKIRATKYVIYDDDQIEAILLDGEPVTKSDFLGRELPPGHYEIIRYARGVGEWTEELDVYESKEFDPSSEKRKDEKKKEGKAEALNPSNPQFKIHTVYQGMCELLDQNKEYVQSAVSSSIGLVCNKHSVERVKFVKNQGKVFELDTTKRVKSVDGFHKDAVVIDTSSIDGLVRLKLRYFDDPVIGQQVTLVTSQLKVSQGEVVSTNSGDVEITFSTVPGDCGSAYVNSNGKIVGIHYSAGVPGKTNLGMGVSSLMKAWGKTPSSSKN